MFWDRVEKPITEINHCLFVISPMLVTDAALKHIGLKQNFLLYLIYFSGDLIITDRWLLSKKWLLLVRVVRKDKKD